MADLEFRITSAYIVLLLALVGNDVLCSNGISSRRPALVAPCMLLVSEYFQSPLTDTLSFRVFSQVAGTEAIVKCQVHFLLIAKKIYCRA